ncbi:hypothetical protein OOK13_29245 [Streptomyces sp. NBC_00378]|uniref:hypothetical protein n=1 Tax=unclassified Streptomyces TaxID=2593676 RepID=UPI00224D30F0|nr:MULTISPECIES: hypothetical protein [unclassified Streptomyces]MCX5112492.1 hypothetical protein [Streptomyces sp. NBC_00378]
MDLKAFAKSDTPVIEGRGFGGITRTDIKTPLTVRERCTLIPQFSDHQVTAGPVPAPRSAPARRRPPQAKIAQRVVPHDLRPVALRKELTEPGGLFRAYQQRTEPDVALLADLQECKARAFTTWAEVTYDGALRRDPRHAGAGRCRHPPAAPAAHPAASWTTGLQWTGC